MNACAMIRACMVGQCVTEERQTTYVPHGNVPADPVPPCQESLPVEDYGIEGHRSAITLDLEEMT